jgi:hypothetical protein
MAGAAAAVVGRTVERGRNAAARATPNTIWDSLSMH